MMKRLLFACMAILLSCDAYAATSPKVSFGNTAPTTCNPANGDFWIDTNGTAGNRLYICTATNTYTLNDGLASTKAPSSAFASQSAFTSAWGWTPGGVSAWSDVQALISGTGDYIKYDGTRGDPTGSVDLSAYATALAANPTDCSAGQYATTIAANGNLTCAQVSYSQVGSAPTVGTAGALAAVTTVGATGADTNIPTEQGVREALDLKANASAIAFEAATWADIKILDTTHTVPGTGIAIVQDAMAYGHADDAYHQWSIHRTGSELAGKQPTITFGTNVQTALGINIGSAGAPVLFNGAGGTPTSLGLTNALLASSTSLPGTCTVGQVYQDTDADTDGDVYFCRATNTWKAIDDDGGAGGLATTDIDTSAELRAILGDEVGTGAAYFVGGALGTPASATLTNATGLPLSGVTDSTTEALGAGTLELGHASDTTIARSGAGAVTIEGVAVVTASSTVTKTNLTLDTAGTGNSITVPLNGVLDGAITDPADADDMIYKKVQNAMTLTDIHCLAEGGGTITLTLQECTAAGESCANIETAITCDADGAEDDGTLSDASIAAGAWIKVLYSAPTGTVNNVAWTAYGTQTW